jgi:VWFA-related protein
MPAKLRTLLLLCAAAAASQAIEVPSTAQTNPAQPSATIRQTVNNVLVDVVVTDKNGQPIKGLSKERFQLLENGAAQQIAFFEEHQAKPAPSAPAPLPALPANVYSNVVTTAPDTGPTIVLLMDALNTPTGDQVKVRLAMLDYLRRIPQGRQIAIFTLTSKLRMLQGFNSDPAALMAALDQAAAWQKQSHLTDDAGKDSYADTMPKLDIGKGAGNAQDVLSNFVAHEQSWRMDERVGYTLNALNALAAYLSALPGRKNLIWFSSSFPLGIGPDSPMPQGFDPSKFTSENLGRSRDYNSALHSTGELLKQARVAVYPMDPSALPTPSMFSSTQTNNDSLRNSGAAISQINAESSNEVSAHSTMDTLAEATGGRAFHNTNDLAGAIGTVTQLGSNYYTVAYVPKVANYDGKYRKLVIKVDAPKAKLDYRRGYYAEDPDKSGVGALAHPGHTTSALLHGAPALTDIFFKVRVTPAENAPATHPGVVRYSITWSIDLSSLKLAQAVDGTMRGSVTFALVAYNSDSKVVNTVSAPAQLNLQPDEYDRYLKTGVQYHQELDLPSGPLSLRVAVVDESNDRAGATEIPLVVRAPAAQVNTTQPVAPH